MKDIITVAGSKLTTTSKVISAVFGKVHRNVYRDIENLECRDEFREINFEQSYYLSPQNKTIKCYNITEKGFYFLCMSLTGKQEDKWNE